MITSKTYWTTSTPTLFIYDDNYKQLASIHLNLDGVDDEDDDRDAFASYVESLDNLPEDGIFVDYPMYKINFI